MCIIIEAINLAAIMSKDGGTLGLKLCSLNMNFHIIVIIYNNNTRIMPGMCANAGMLEFIRYVLLVSKLTALF